MFSASICASMSSTRDLINSRSSRSFRQAPFVGAQALDQSDEQLDFFFQPVDGFEIDRSSCNRFSQCVPPDSCDLPSFGIMCRAERLNDSLGGCLCFVVCQCTIRGAEREPERQADAPFGDAFPLVAVELCDRDKR